MEKKRELLMNLVLMPADFFAVSVSPSLFSDDELVDSSSSNVEEPIGNGVGKLNLKRGMSLLIQGGVGLTCTREQFKGLPFERGGRLNQNQMNPK